MAHIKLEQESGYPTIAAWCRMMGSHGYYINQQIKEAKEDKAPADAIYKRHNSDEWARLSGVTSTETQWYFIQNHRELVEKFAPGWIDERPHAQ